MYTCQDVLPEDTTWESYMELLKFLCLRECAHLNKGGGGGDVIVIFGDFLGTSIILCPLEVQ